MVIYMALASSHDAVVVSGMRSELACYIIHTRQPENQYYL